MSLTGDDNAMTQRPHSREIDFDGVFNFRDIGGYRSDQGRTVALRRVCRSAELSRMTLDDLSRMKQELGVRSVLDFHGRATSGLTKASGSLWGGRSRLGGRNNTVSERRRLTASFLCSVNLHLHSGPLK